MGSAAHRSTPDALERFSFGRSRLAASPSAQTGALFLLGMVLIGVGTFFAQATTTGLVSRVATADRGAASGMYLASYFAGGLVGTAVLGQAFDRIGWSACVAGIAISLGVAAALALCFKSPAR